MAHTLVCRVANKAGESQCEHISMHAHLYDPFSKVYDFCIICNCPPSMG